MRPIAVCLLALALSSGCKKDESDLFVFVAPGYDAVLEFSDSIIGVDSDSLSVRASAAGEKLILRVDSSTSDARSTEGHVRLRLASGGEYVVRYEKARMTPPVSVGYVSENDRSRVTLAKPVVLSVSNDTSWVSFPAPVARMDIAHKGIFEAGVQGNRVFVRTLGSPGAAGDLMTVILQDSVQRTIPIVLSPGPGPGRSYQWMGGPSRLEPQP